MPFIKKSTLARARKAGGYAKRGLGGAKASAIQGLVGAIGYAGHYFGSQKVDFVREKYWAGPVAIAVVGHIVKKKRPGKGYGDALLGAAGYAFAQAYNAHRQSQQASNADTAPPAAETGAMLRAGDVGALIDREYDTGVAGYLDDTRNPTSSFYRDLGTEPASDEAIAEAMGL
ncbi:MAG: hypothetical protein A2Y74_05355 [Actinobacteria bacterium RBG_13_63_9]|nr:MAG: hypothetical protein A2Y74_05355 [Actinobacteria bacterium RBG_13_63_9]